MTRAKGQGASYTTILCKYLGKSVLGTGNGKCKGPPDANLCSCSSELRRERRRDQKVRGKLQSQSGRGLAKVRTKSDSLGPLMQQTTTLPSGRRGGSEGYWKGAPKVQSTEQAMFQFLSWVIGIWLLTVLFFISIYVLFCILTYKNQSHWKK